MSEHGGNRFRFYAALFLAICLLIMQASRSVALEQALLNSDESAVFYEECMNFKIAFEPKDDGLPVWLNLVSVTLDGAVPPRCSQPETDARNEISALLESASGRLVQTRFLMNPEDVQGVVLLEMRPGENSAAPMDFKLTFQTRAGEHYYGFDQKLNTWDLRGISVDYLGQDEIDDGAETPVNVKKQSSLIVPLLLSSRGYGVWLGGGDTAAFDMDSEGQGVWSFETHSSHLRVYFLAGPDPNRVLERYNRLTGRPALDPDLSSVTE